MSATTSTHDTNARFEPLRAKPHAPGMVVVENLSRDSEHIVDLRGRVCDCKASSSTRRATTCGSWTSSLTATSVQSVATKSVRRLAFDGVIHDECRSYA